MKRKVVFLKSAVFPQDYPIANRVEIAIGGRSNAGKSSLLNALVNSKVAKVSQLAGKTRLLNFFDVSDKYRIVDMPGYGWSKQTQSEMKTWQKMIETYLNDRPTLAALILVMDARRDWDDEEKMLKQFCDSVKLPLILVLTKVDRISKNEAASRQAKIKKQSGVDDIYRVSSTTGSGIVEFEDSLFQKYVKPGIPEVEEFLREQHEKQNPNDKTFQATEDNGEEE